MLDDRLKTKLRDRTCLEGHRAPVRSIHVTPAALVRHIAIFDRLNPLPGFKVAVRDSRFNAATRRRLRFQREGLREQNTLVRLSDTIRP